MLADSMPKWPAAIALALLNAADGQVLYVIQVGRQPHGLTYFPQPGRFSLGHNGVYR